MNTISKLFEIDETCSDSNYETISLLSTFLITLTKILLKNCLNISKIHTSKAELPD